jgi:hypothetical protein
MGGRGLNTSTTEQDAKIHCFARSEGIAAVAIATKDYPQVAAHTILGEVLDEFLKLDNLSQVRAATKDNTITFPQLKEYIKTYQDPNQVSKISAIQTQLDETKIILHKTIDSVGLPFPSGSSGDGAEHVQLTMRDRCCKEERSSTIWWPGAMICLPRARCSTRRPRSKTRVACTCALLIVT